MKLDFGYGNGTQSIEIDEERILDVLSANELKHERREEAAVEYAMEHPIGTGLLHLRVKPEMKIAIVVSDISRPVPSYQILPSIVNELEQAGVPDENITIVFALGSHRNHTAEEKKKLVGEAVYDRFRCIDSNEEGYIHLGETGRGTPVDVAKAVAEADFRICTGNVEFHYFAGYSGGYKAIMPGCSSVDAIQKNHTAMTDENAHAGKIEGNPVREDIEAAGRICGVDYLINVVLDEHRHIVYAAAGDVVKAHRDCCRYLDRMYLCPITERADIVIVSQGGAPKDANLYQVQKALDNAKHAVKKGGSIILLGACPEGLGSKPFEEWMNAAKTPQDLIVRISREFVLGGHKAAAIAMVLQNANIYLVSELPEETVRNVFMIPCHSLEEAMERATEKQGVHSTVIAMPFGGATLPVSL